MDDALVRLPFKRLLMLGTHDDGRVWVEVEWGGDRLSISGVVGPKRNGDCTGSAGQMHDALLEPIKLAAGWDAERVAQLYKVWRDFHLNDMRAGCEHQRAEGWDKRPIDPSKPTNTYGKHFEGQRSDSWNMLTWIRPEEHPEGLMTKPCPVCGYKYGTAWLREEVPTEALAFLRSLPEATIDYPWTQR